MNIFTYIHCRFPMVDKQTQGQIPSDFIPETGLAYLAQEVDNSSKTGRTSYNFNAGCVKELRPSGFIKRGKLENPLTKFGLQ